MKGLARRVLTRQFLEFAVGGGLGALMGLALLYVFVEVAGVTPTWAFVAQFWITLMFNYAVTHYVFVNRGDRAGGSHREQITYFVVTRLAVFGINWALFALLMLKEWGVPYQAVWANVPCLVVGLLLNFLAAKKVVFRRLASNRA